ncbi:probable vesicular acetylcholine transporter-B [Amphiura filiformis]|uniref:probable vesicular acetylcholine transporter-B n=1 Tax=Amphiura filiformis TaxID=82378 RepID=UPI003B226E5A
MTLIFAFFSSFEAIFIACILQGLAGAFNTPNAFAKMSQLFAPDTTAAKLSLCLVMTANIFSFIGPAMEGFLYEYIGQMWCFLVLLLPLELLLILGTLFNLFCNHDNDNCISRNELKLLKTNERNEVNSDDSNASDNNRLWLLLNPRIIIAAATFGLAWLPRKCIDSTVAVWMDAKFSSGPSVVGLVLSLAAISVPTANIVGASFASIWTTRIHMFTAICIALCSIPVSTMFLSPNPATVSVCYAVYIFFASSSRYGAMNLLSNIAENTKDSSRGTVMSAASVGLSICNLIGPVLAIPLYNYFGFAVICLSIGPLCCLFAPLLCSFNIFSATV